MKKVNLIWLWKLAITRYAVYSLVVLITAYKMATDSIGWTAMTGEEHFDVILDMISAWATMTVAYLDKAEKAVETGDFPPDMTLTHEEVTTTKKVITDNPPDSAPTISTQSTVSKSVTAQTLPAETTPENQAQQKVENK